MKVYEGRLYDVTVLPKPTLPKMSGVPEFVKHKYYVIEAESAEEAAKVGAEVGKGEVLNVGFNTIRTVVLKEKKDG